MSPTKTAKLHFLDHWRVIRVRLGLVVLIFLLVVITVGVITYFTPKEYMSFATIEVEPNMQPVRIFADSPAAEETAVADPKFTKTQFEIIMRKGVLYPVIQRLELEKRWARDGQPLTREQAYNKLKSMLQLTEVRNTNLIQIDVYSTDPDEAALLANTVSTEYMEQRISEAQAIIEKGLDQMRDEVAQKEKAVNDAYAEASRLRTEAGIIDPNPDSFDSGSRVEDSSVLTNQEKVNDSRSQIAKLKSKVEQLDHLNSDDLMRVEGMLELNDPILEQKLPLYQNAVAERAKLLNSGLGHNHPDVKAIQAQIDTIERQLRQQIDSVRRGLVTEVTISENSLQSMEKNLANSQVAQQEKKTASAQYLDAKYRYLQERKLLEQAKTRLSSETMERTMPQKPAAIRDQAEPASKASRPKVVLNMILGVIAGLVLGIAFAYFLEYLDTSVRTMEDVERLLDLPVLGIVPRGIKLLPETGEDTPDAEAYRIMQTGVDIARRKLDVSVITVVSGGPSEGKSTTACNLATSFARSGLLTLIVDGDLRRPVQHRLFNLDNRIGLAEFLRGQAELEAIIQTTEIPFLSVMTSGEHRNGVFGLLKSGRMRELVKRVKGQFDVVLFDCPPILGLSDASALSELAEGAIIVTQHRKFPKSMLVRVKGALQTIGTPCLGVVLNEVDVRYDNTYRYYTRYGNYYYQDRNSRGKSRELVPANGAVKPSSSRTPSANGSEPKAHIKPSDQRPDTDFTDDVY
jgi:polysaccharide biosynthesis transport protein